MLVTLLLIHLSSSNAQWPVQSIGKLDLEVEHHTSDQPGYPYDDVTGIHDDTQTPLTTEATIFPKIVKKPQNITVDTAWVLEEVRNLAHKNSALRNKTDALMHELHYFYDRIALDEADNKENTANVYKYGMSVILRFLLEFYRIFRKLVSSQSSHAQLINIDVYAISYDDAVDVMKTKGKYTPVQLSTPIRRSTDIFRSILYESVQIVQTECSAMTPNWQCVILYLANLISESVNCSNIWYHAFIHMLALKTKFAFHDSFVAKIVGLPLFKEAMYFENMFDFVMDKLVEYREVGRIQLSAEAVIFTMLADMQENGLLDCITVDYLYN